jgi:hypothetical protein
MTHPALTVGPDLPVAAAAQVLDEHRIRRVPVVSGGRLVGVVSRGDLFRAFARFPVAPSSWKPATVSSLGLLGFSVVTTSVGASTIRTGQGARRATASATLPRARGSRRSLPCVPTTIRSAREGHPAIGHGCPGGRCQIRG